MSASEASAVGSIRTINVAASEYGATYGGHPSTLTQIATVTGESISCNNTQFIGD
jgi:hypothetical protein